MTYNKKNIGPEVETPAKAPTFSGKVVDFAAAREGAARDKGEKSVKGKAKAPRDKMSQSRLHPCYSINLCLGASQKRSTDI